MAKLAWLQMGAAAIMAASASHAWSQSYPTRTVRIVVPYAAGGNTDLATMGAILGFAVMMVLDVALG